MAIHITPGRNGWTENAVSMLRAIERKEREKLYADKAEEDTIAREKAELEYYKRIIASPVLWGILVLKPTRIFMSDEV